MTSGKLGLIGVHPRSSAFIRVHPRSSAFIRVHPRSSAFIRVHPRSSAFIRAQFAFPPAAQMYYHASLPKKP